MGIPRNIAEPSGAMLLKGTGPTGLLLPVDEHPVCAVSAFWSIRSLGWAVGWG